MSENFGDVRTAMSDQTDKNGVATLLRQSRENTGATLDEVAAMLRIRQTYLEAIEDGRFTDLPGQTYAIGFIRGYAEHLGLDSDEVVRRYKDEVISRVGPTNLRFPTPIIETSIPSGTIVFFGFLAVVLAYGAWLVNATEEGFLSDLVAPLPERFAALILDEEKIPVINQTDASPNASGVGTKTKPTLKSEPKVDPRAEPKVEPQAEPKAEPQAEPRLKSGSKLELKVEPFLAEEASSRGLVKPPVKYENKSIHEPSLEQTPESLPEPVSSVPAGSPELSTKTNDNSLKLPIDPATPEKKELETILTSPAQQTETENLAIDSRAPPASEITSGTPALSDLHPQSPLPSYSETLSTEQPFKSLLPESRITVRARANSWIEVRDDFSNTNLMARLLNKGDSYNVPNQAGLSLHTGNAGALEILVDGVVVPAIGELGAVQRGVQLDPDALVAGTATQ